MGSNAASGSQPRPREERKGATRTEDSGGHQSSSAQPTGGCQCGEIQTGVFLLICAVGTGLSTEIALLLSS